MGRQLKTDQSGLTFMNVLIIVMFAGIVLAFGLVAYSSLSKSSKDAERTDDARMVWMATKDYNKENGSMPTMVDQIIPHIGKLSFYENDSINPVDVWKAGQPMTAGKILTYQSNTDPGNRVAPTGKLNQKSLAIITKALCSNQISKNTIKAGGSQGVAVVYKNAGNQIVCISNSN